MRLIGRQKTAATNVAETSRKWLSAWMHEISNAQWGDPKELKRQFPLVEELGDNKYLFGIQNSNFVIEIQVSFDLRTVLITNISEAESK